MGIRQFILYQMKDTSGTKPYRFRPYKVLQEKGFQVWNGVYEQVYVGIILPGDTPEKIRERFNRKLPKAFRGHSISVSDVMVLKAEEVAVAYYVDVDRFIVLDRFFRKNESSGSKLSLGDSNVHIKGKGGTWHVFEGILIEKDRFFLMEHEKYGQKAAWVVVDEYGNLVADGIREGGDQSVRKKIKDYTEQNQRKGRGDVQKNAAMRKTQGRASVLEKLRQKQRKIAENRGDMFET